MVEVGTTGFLRDEGFVNDANRMVLLKSEATNSLSIAKPTRKTNDIDVFERKEKRILFLKHCSLGLPMFPELFRMQ
jgi:hypothetical protein